MSSVWKVLIPSNVIKERIKVMAADIQGHINSSKAPVVLAIVTQGGVRFGMELVNLLDPETYHWGLIGTSSYGGNEHGSKVNLLFSRLGDVAGKEVIIVDDIGDRRKTLLYVQQLLLGPEEAAAVHTAVLLNKPSRKEHDVPLDWIGFNIQDTFVSGYGLDGGEGYSFTRNYPEIRYKEGSLNESEPHFWLPEQLPA